LTITSIKNDLTRASRESFAVPLYDVFDQIGVDGVLEAAENKKAPVIMGIYSGAKVMHYAGAFTAYLRARAERSCVPVSIMLDHGASVDQCLYALECGFTDVMYDGSSLSIEENIENTRKVVQAAHACGAAVEAELGHVGSGSEYDAYGGLRHGFTNPDMVEKFIAETGIDFLAIAFGNAHGMYKGEPHLDLDLVKEIRHRVEIPLVMHGGTGLEDHQYREVIKSGIAKINLFTVIHNEATRRMVLAAQEKNASMFSFTEQEQAAYCDVCEHYLDVLEAAGKAACD
jgi:fructose-bisphosphate aldolase, class II